MLPCVGSVRLFRARVRSDCHDVGFLRVHELVDRLSALARGEVIDGVRSARVGGMPVRAALIASRTSATVATVLPPTSRMTSPSLKPAAATENWLPRRTTIVAFVSFIAAPDES